MAQLLGKSDKENYQKVQYDYWDLYYKVYPEYLPPSINIDEKYKLYLEVCAISNMEYAFDPSRTKKQVNKHYYNREFHFTVRMARTMQTVLHSLNWLTFSSVILKIFSKIFTAIRSIALCMNCCTGNSFKNEVVHVCAGMAALSYFRR